MWRPQVAKGESPSPSFILERPWRKIRICEYSSVPMCVLKRGTIMTVCPSQCVFGGRGVYFEQEIWLMSPHLYFLIPLRSQENESGHLNGKFDGYKTERRWMGALIPEPSWAHPGFPHLKVAFGKRASVFIPFLSLGSILISDHCRGKDKLI